MSNSLRNLRIVLKCKSVFQEEAAISHRVFIRLVGLIVLAPLAPTIMFSQATQLGFSNSPPSFGHGHDYIQQFNETVNPADGSLTLRIGVPTPPGRGLNFPYALTYNSSSIHGFYQPPPPGPGQSGPMLMQWAYPSFIPNTAQGWSDTLPRLIAQHTPYFEGYTNPYGDQAVWTVTCESWQGFQFTDLSGQVHQPSLIVSGVNAYENAGCDGNAGAIGADGTIQVYGQLGGSASFATPDGTFYEYPLSSGLAGGPVVVFPLLIEDKNGNKLTIGNGSTTSYSFGTFSAVDTLGRTVISLQPADANHKTLSISGIPNPYTITFGSGAGSSGSAIPQASYNYATGSTANTIPAMPALSGGISSLGLPDGGSYSFSYDPLFGNVNKITYPNGGTVSYTWGFPAGYSDDANYSAPYIACEGNGCASYNPAADQVYVQYSMPVILSRTVSFDGQNPALTQTFNYQTTFRPGDMIDGWTSKTTTVTTNDLVAGTTSSVIYSYSPFSERAQNPTQRYTGQTAQEYQTVYKDGNGNVLQTVCKSWLDSADLLNTQTTILPNGMVSEHAFSYGSLEVGYGSNGIPAATGYVFVPNGDDYYDFSAPQLNPTCANPQVSLVEPTPGPMLSSTRQNLTFATTSLYPYGPSIVNTPSSTITKDGSGNTVAETDYQYTNAIAQTVSGVVQHDTAFDSGSQVRQNLYSATKQCFPSCTSVTTTYSYDNTGQVVAATDSNGNTTNYYYTDAYSANTGQPSSVTNAYPTTVMEPTTNGVQHIQHATYGYNDGKVRSITDENSNVTTYCYATGGCSGASYDPWMRLTQVLYPDGGSKSATYNDAGSSPTVVSSTVLSSSSTLVQTAIGDGMGHVIHSQTNSDPAGTVTVDTVYGGTGAVFSTSNPYRSASDATYGVTAYTYDGLGRKILQQQPDGSLLQWCYNGIASISSQTVCTSNKSSLPNTTWVDTADELGSHSQQVSDGTGRLLAVMEPDPSSNVPALETDYTYSALSNLLSVTQKGNSTDTPRLRSFSYDSLSRLTSAQNPETGTQIYAYSNGSAFCAGDPSLPCSKTDARGAITQYTYDQLNRLTGKSYVVSGTSAAPTLPTTFIYDTNNGTPVPNAIGHLVSEVTGSAASPTTQRTIAYYDPVGRVKQETQCITVSGCSGTQYTFQHMYDLAGNMTYSNNGVSSMGIGLTYGYDGAARLNTVSSTWEDAKHPATLFSAPQGVAQYSPAGGLLNAVLGWNPSNSQYVATMARAYDNRLRLTSETDTASPTLPGNGSTNSGTKSIGSITISGTEGSTTRSATSGNACIYISGSENEDVIIRGYDEGPDSGDIRVTVNGVSDDYGWGDGDDIYSIAAGLTLAINGDSAQPVIAQTFPGEVVCVTAKTTGSATNYTFTVTNTDDYRGADPSFEVDSSGSTLDGGANATTSPDTGTIAVSVNGVTVSASWQSGSSAGTIANQLFNQFQSVAGSFLSSTLSGNTINLTSVAASSNANWPLLYSVTDTNSQAASFSVTDTGMSGGTSPSSSSGSSVLYSYAIPAFNSSNTAASGYAANGNLQHVTDSVTGGWAYQYDPLNRLIAAQASANPQTGVAPYGTALLGWSYDSFGNNKGETLSGSTSLSIPQVSYSFTGSSLQNGVQLQNALNNRIDGYNYDAAGNLLSDPIGGLNYYSYDAEGRVSSVGGTVQYLYDAEGQRVGKLSSGTLTNQYLLGPGGEQVSELDGQGNWLHSNVFVGGRLLATYKGSDTYFALNDWLGTKRVEVTPDGCVTSFGSLPFGDALTSQGNCPDASEQHFTGKERDTESGLDYFGARYYASSMGRMMSPDWSAKAEPVPYAKLDNPQSLNLYSYVGNNPLSRTDPTGHYVCSSGKANCTALREALANVREAAGNLDKGSKEQKALNKVLSFYGKEGKDNGVTVTFQKVGLTAGGTSTENGRTTVSLSLKDVSSNPAYKQNGASPDTEAAGQVAHEGEHGVQQQDHGMPQSKAQEKAGEVDAFTVQSYVNKGLQDNSAYGIWTIQGGFNAAAVNDNANASTAAYCQMGGNCK